MKALNFVFSRFLLNSTLVTVTYWRERERERERGGRLPCLRIGNNGSGFIQVLIDDGLGVSAIQGDEGDDIVAGVCVEEKAGDLVHGDSVRPGSCRKEHIQSMHVKLNNYGEVVFFARDSLKMKKKFF